MLTLTQHTSYIAYNIILTVQSYATYTTYNLISSICLVSRTWRDRASKGHHRPLNNLPKKKYPIREEFALSLSLSLLKKRFNIFPTLFTLLMLIITEANEKCVELMGMWKLLYSSAGTCCSGEKKKKLSASINKVFVRLWISFPAKHTVTDIKNIQFSWYMIHWWKCSFLLSRKAYFSNHLICYLMNRRKL